MGKIRQNKQYIVPGALISASYVADLYDLLTSNTPEDVAMTGSLTITGSLVVSGSNSTIRGFLNDTASWAISASRAGTASIAISSSHAAYSKYAETAGNVGVTQIVAGHNISISPTSGTGSVTIHSTCCGCSGGSTSGSIGTQVLNLGVSGVLAVSGALFVNPAALPTSDPGVAGQVWRSGNFLVISLG